MEGLLFALKGLICMGSKGRRPVLHSRIEDTEALTACNPVNPVILQPKITLNRNKGSACESIRWRRVVTWEHLEAGKPSAAGKLKLPPPKEKQKANSRSLALPACGRQARDDRVRSEGRCGTAESRALTFKGKNKGATTGEGCCALLN